MGRPLLSLLASSLRGSCSCPWLVRSPCACASQPEAVFLCVATPSLHTSHSDQLRPLEVQLASLASFEDLVTHSIHSLLEPTLCPLRRTVPCLPRTRVPAPAPQHPSPSRRWSILLSERGSPTWQSSAAPPAPPERSCLSPPWLQLTGSCSRSRATGVRRHHQLCSRLVFAHVSRRRLARKRSLPSQLVGTPTPLTPGGPVAGSDGGAHASKRNGLCGVRFSVKFSAASRWHLVLRRRTQHPHLLLALVC